LPKLSGSWRKERFWISGIPIRNSMIHFSNYGSEKWFNPDVKYFLLGQKIF
jgi:hypothetical protein